MTTTRPDGHATHYDYQPESAHFIEQTVMVYLRLSDGQTRWIVDGASVDGYGLDSSHTDETATNDECACGKDKECEAVRRKAETIPLPNGPELAQLILDAIPTEST